jgi:hypothetical protein
VPHLHVVDIDDIVSCRRIDQMDRTRRECEGQRRRVTAETCVHYTACPERNSGVNVSRLCFVKTKTALQLKLTQKLYASCKVICLLTALRESQSGATFISAGRTAVTCTRLEEGKVLFESEPRGCRSSDRGVGIGETPYLTLFCQRSMYRCTRRLVFQRGGHSSIPGLPI